MTIQYSDHPKAEAGTACSICGRIPDRPRIEHCHPHGWVRGVACGRCNAAMALLDRGYLPQGAVESVPLDLFIEHAARCPDCPPVAAGDLVRGSLRPAKEVAPLAKLKLRLEPEEYALLESQAVEDDRSLNAQIKWLIKQEAKRRSAAINAIVTEHLRETEESK